MNKDNNSISAPDMPDKDDTDIKIYEGVAECNMNESDNLKTVKLRAKDLAQENAQKKIADYVSAFLKDRLLSLPDDEILSVANEISNITDVKYNALDSDDNIVIRATVTAQLDDKDIMNCITRFFKERAELKSQNEALRKENEALKQEMNKKTQEFDEAFNLYIETDYEGVIKLFNEAIKRKPDCSLLYYRRGRAYSHRLFEKELAIADFTKAIELNPNFAEAYYSRGSACHYGILEESDSQDFDKAIELNPNLADAYLYRGKAYGYSVHKERAIANFTKAIELNPNYVTAYSNRAFIYKYLGQKELAIADFTKAIELEPNEVMYYNNRGNAYYDFGQYELAIQDFNKAIQLNPNKAYLGSQEPEQAEQAIPYLDKYIEHNPNNYVAYFIRSSSYIDLGKYEQAIQDYSKVIELSPNFARAYKNRGSCYQELGEEAKAQADFAKAKELGYSD